MIFSPPANFLYFSSTSLITSVIPLLVFSIISVISFTIGWLIIKPVVIGEWPILNRVNAISAVTMLKFISPAIGSLALSTNAARKPDTFLVINLPSAFLMSWNELYWCPLIVSTYSGAIPNWVLCIRACEALWLAAIPINDAPDIFLWCRLTHVSGVRGFNTCLLSLTISSSSSRL